MCKCLTFVTSEIYTSLSQVTFKMCLLCTVNYTVFKVKLYNALFKKLSTCTHDFMHIKREDQINFNQ